MEDRAAATGPPSDRWVFGIALGLALAPLVVLAVHLIVTGDEAFIRDRALTELRVRDVGRHPVLLGLYSRDGWSHPGPALFYTLAIPYRLLGSGSTGLVVGATAINTAAVAATAVIARRLGGLRVALLVLLGLSVTVVALGATFWSDPWVCFVTVLPFALFATLAWAMSLGRFWALPVAAVLGSWLVQAHVGYAPLTAPVVVLGAGWLLLRAWRGDDRDARRRVGYALALTGGLVVLVWLPALWDQAFRSGNLGKTADWFSRAEEGTASVTEGARVVFGQLAVLPDWMTGQRRASGINGETTLRTMTRWPILLVPFALAVVYAWRRRARPLGAYAVVTVILLGLAVVAVSRTVGVMYEYRLIWIWPLALMVVVTIGWAGWDLVAERFPGSDRTVLLPLALGGLAVASIVGVVGAAQGSGPTFVSPVTGDVSEALASYLASDRRPVVLHADSAVGKGYVQGLVLGLESRGVDARVGAGEAALVGEHRVVDERAHPTRLVVVADEDLDGFEPTAGQRLVAYDGPVPYDRRMRLGAQAAAARRRLVEARAAGTLSPADLLRELARTRTPGPALAVFVDAR